jgi:recombinational DNA repair protein (RecF pathway)
MKKCSICGKEITTYKYYESDNDSICLKCGDIELVEEIELYQGGHDNPFIRADEVRDVYNDDVIQDIELFALTQYEDDELEELIEHLNQENKCKEAYIRGLEKRVA